MEKLNCTKSIKYFELKWFAKKIKLFGFNNIFLLNYIIQLVL